MAKFGVIAAAFMTVAFVAAAIGWILNIIKLIAMLSDPITTETILRIVGIPIAFLGGILGYF